jgi:hypothetical protein
MPIEELGKQELIARAPQRLTPQKMGVVLLRQPHLLQLQVNGRSIIVESGGGTAATWITNEPPLPSTLRAGEMPRYDRVGSIRFDINAELVPLSEAMRLARALCEDMGQAKLGRARPEWDFASVFNWSGQHREVHLSDFAAVQQLFLDPIARPETIGVCRLSDGTTYFELEVRNYRRGPGLMLAPALEVAQREAKRATESVYRVSGTVSWDNENAPQTQRDGRRGPARGSFGGF